MKTQWLVIPTVFLLLTGCDDSTNPLSDPQNVTADEGLVGVWREEDGEVYYRIDHAGKKFPKGVMRVVAITRNQASIEPPEEYLAYSALLAGKAYLNVVVDEKQVTLLNAEGWNAAVVDAYIFVKYQLDGDNLTVWLTDEKAKEQAIKIGKIKGVAHNDQVARFTDTTENIIRFIANAGDSLWNTKEPCRFERVPVVPSPSPQASPSAALDRPIAPPAQQRSGPTREGRYSGEDPDCR